VPEHLRMDRLRHCLRHRPLEEEEVLLLVAIDRLRHQEELLLVDRLWQWRRRRSPAALPQAELLAIDRLRHCLARDYLL
jgi:hypothetical protein